jgi:hypothetical protein
MSRYLNIAVQACSKTTLWIKKHQGELHSFVSFPIDNRNPLLGSLLVTKSFPRGYASWSFEQVRIITTDKALSKLNFIYSGG